MKIYQKYFIVLAILLLPVLFFVYYEYNTSAQTEQAFINVYKNHIDDIVYSENQFIEDYIKSIRSDFLYEPEIKKNDNEYYHNQGIVFIVSFDSGKNFKIHLPPADNKSEGYIKDLVNSKKSTLKKLKDFARENYDKLEAEKEDGKILIFSYRNNRFIIISLDPQTFISRNISPRFNTRTGSGYLIEDNFVITISDSTQRNNNSYLTRQPVWLLPTYKFFVSLNKSNFKDVIKDRLQNSLIMIILVVLSIMTTIIIIILNLRKEIQLSRTKSDFVSNVSHELRTPLSLIMMYAETLKLRRIKEERIPEYHETIFNEAQRLSGLVNNLLSFSRIENNKMKYDIKENDLIEIINTVIDFFRIHLESNHFNVELDLPEKLVFNFDSNSISSALVNILDNAIKYSGQSKRIIIRAGLVDKFAFVEIKDFGIGIPSKLQNKIFEKFFRVESSLTQNTKGTGIGLTIVKHIVDTHKGHIEINSEVNQGTTFKILLPCRN